MLGCAAPPAIKEKVLSVLVSADECEPHEVLIRVFGSDFCDSLIEQGCLCRSNSPHFTCGSTSHGNNYVTILKEELSHSIRDEISGYSLAILDVNREIIGYIAYLYYRDPVFT